MKLQWLEAAQEKELDGKHGKQRRNPIAQSCACRHSCDLGGSCCVAYLERSPDVVRGVGQADKLTSGTCRGGMTTVTCNAESSAITK